MEHLGLASLCGAIDKQTVLSIFIDLLPAERLLEPEGGNKSKKSSSQPQLHSDEEIGHSETDEHLLKQLARVLAPRSDHKRLRIVILPIVVTA